MADTELDAAATTLRRLGLPLSAVHKASLYALYQQARHGDASTPAPADKGARISWTAWTCMQGVVPQDAAAQLYIAAVQLLSAGQSWEPPFFLSEQVEKAIATAAVEGWATPARGGPAASSPAAPAPAPSSGTKASSNLDRLRKAVSGVPVAASPPAAASTEGTLPPPPASLVAPPRPSVSSSTSAARPAATAPSYAGWLLKMREHVPLRPSRGRWVHLVGRELRYYEVREGAGGKPKDVIHLPFGTVVTVVNGGADKAPSGAGKGGKMDTGRGRVSSLLRVPGGGRDGGDGGGESSGRRDSTLSITSAGERSRPGSPHRRDSTLEAGGGGGVDARWRLVTPTRDKDARVHIVTPDEPSAPTSTSALLIFTIATPAAPDKVYKLGCTGPDAEAARDTWVALLRAAVSGERGLMDVGRQTPGEESARLLAVGGEEHDTPETTPGGRPSHAPTRAVEEGAHQTGKAQGTSFAALLAAASAGAEAATGPASADAPSPVVPVHTPAPPSPIPWTGPTPPPPTLADDVARLMDMHAKLTGPAEGSVFDATWTNNGKRSGVACYSPSDGSPGARGDTFLPFSRRAIQPLVSDITRKSETDTQFETGSIVHRMSDHLCLTHLKFKPVGFVASRDFLVLVYTGVREDGALFLATTSVTPQIYDALPADARAACTPELPNTVRGIVHFGGWVVRPRPGVVSAAPDAVAQAVNAGVPLHALPSVDAEGCDVTYVMRSDLKGSIPTFIVKLVAAQQSELPSQVSAVLAREVASRGGKYHAAYPPLLNEGEAARGEAVAAAGQGLGERPPAPIRVFAETVNTRVEAVGEEAGARVQAATLRAQAVEAYTPAAVPSERASDAALPVVSPHAAGVSFFDPSAVEGRMIGTLNHATWLAAASHAAALPWPASAQAAVVKLSALASRPGWLPAPVARPPWWVSPGGGAEEDGPGGLSPILLTLPAPPLPVAASSSPRVHPASSRPAVPSAYRLDAFLRVPPLTVAAVVQGGLGCIGREGALTRTPTVQSGKHVVQEEWRVSGSGPQAPLLLSMLACRGLLGHLPAGDGGLLHASEQAVELDADGRPGVRKRGGQMPAVALLWLPAETGRTDVKVALFLRPGPPSRGEAVHDAPPVRSCSLTLLVTSEDTTVESVRVMRAVVRSFRDILRVCGRVLSPDVAALLYPPLPPHPHGPRGDGATLLPDGTLAPTKPPAGMVHTSALPMTSLAGRLGLAREPDVFQAFITCAGLWGAMSPAPSRTAQNHIRRVGGSTRQPGNLLSSLLDLPPVEIVYSVVSLTACAVRILGPWGVMLGLAVTAGGLPSFVRKNEAAHLAVLVVPLAVPLGKGWGSYGLAGMPLQLLVLFISRTLLRGHAFLAALLVSVGVTALAVYILQDGHALAKEGVSSSAKAVADMNALCSLSSSTRRQALLFVNVTSLLQSTVDETVAAGAVLPGASLPVLLAKAVHMAWEESGVVKGETPLGAAAFSSTFTAAIADTSVVGPNAMGAVVYLQDPGRSSLIANGLHLYGGRAGTGELPAGPCDVLVRCPPGPVFPAPRLGPESAKAGDAPAPSLIHRVWRAAALASPVTVDIVEIQVASPSPAPPSSSTPTTKPGTPAPSLVSSATLTLRLSYTRTAGQASRTDEFERALVAILEGTDRAERLHSAVMSQGQAGVSAASRREAHTPWRIGRAVREVLLAAGAGGGAWPSCAVE